jgi:hypothetical protein
MVVTGGEEDVASNDRLSQRIEWTRAHWLMVFG